ncbi:hypothetical protein AB0P12_11785 [Streptomyces subrutilus]|uniref:Uncharacterized protein n=1 Tax=Streptomyces subrutilus TaxID=36818 RepID=A0A5P2UE24_9ACTN|nr:hypothetical protein [Streptomyces subrutilus]QEU77228.1 hypothetical protein CP968_02015 [Streptomyces subrutilus]WSJ33793.1 hypothetical protein OG479_33220 [Streptomyces subrutilus]GGZ45728.1 hypothetical protein GCM10010371_00880 [Streptomyces subrutilus]
MSGPRREPPAAPAGRRARPGRTGGAHSRPPLGRDRLGARGAACVRARFRLSEIPGVTVAPAAGAGCVTPAAAAAARALGEAGLGHLGGHLELRTYGSAPRTVDLARAARRAVAAALARPHDA